MFRIDKSTVGSIDKKNPYVMEGRFARTPRLQDMPKVSSEHGDILKEQEKVPDPITPAEAQAKAIQLIADARKNARLILSEAEAQAEALRAQGWQEGYNRGTADSEVILKRLRMADVADLNTLIDSVKLAKLAVIEESEFELLGIAIETARKIVNYELNDADVYLGFLENALNHIRYEGKVKINIDSEAYNRFMAAHGPASLQRDALEVVLVETPALRAGEATVVFGDESIDLSVDSQIDSIKQELGLI